MTDPVTSSAPQTWRACAELFDQVPQKTNGHVVAARYLRAAADEVDRLRAAEEHLTGELTAVTANRSQIVADYQKLRAMIENAPHTDGCGHMDWVDGVLQLSPCTCWKADVL